MAMQMRGNFGQPINGSNLAILKSKNSNIRLFTVKRNLSKEKLSILADCAYLERGENILITGATGCGKSYLACALGNNACVNGFRTLYFNLNRFTEQIALAKVELVRVTSFSSLSISFVNSRNVLDIY